MSAVPGAKVTPLRAKRKCPECGAPADRTHYPFCSPRCKDVDLNRWLSGAYVISTDEAPDDSGPGHG